MTEIPTFNYRNVNLFVMSLFGITFILSLMDLIKVKDPMAITIASFFNIFIGISGWIGQKAAYSYYENNRLVNLKWYRSWETGIMSMVAIFVFFITLGAILLQR